MSYRHTVISNLKYLDEVFHHLAHNIPYPNVDGYYGKDDSSLLKWECIDDRFSTSFGSTYEVVVNDFVKRNEDIVITIYGDTWLHSEQITYNEHWMSKWEVNNYDYMLELYPFKESLPEVLSRVYPNATVNLIGDYTITSTITIDLDDVISYLSSLSRFPKFFIFNGADKTFVEEGLIATVNKIKIIDNFCTNNGIKACCIFTAYRESAQNVDILEYSEMISTTTSMLKFSTFEWATHHLSYHESNYNYGSNYLPIDSENISNKNLTLDWNRLKFYLTRYRLDYTDRYKELVYIVIKRFILAEFFNLHRECFYISLMCRSVQGGLDASTYEYYYGTQSKPYNFQGLLSKDETDIILSENPYIEGHHQSKYATDQHWNFFKNTGQYVAFCVHTDFSEYLWMGQQGQSNCYDEFVQTRTRGSTINPANLIPERLYRTGSVTSETGPCSPPIFSGTGCPWITISKDNREKYQNKLGMQCPIEVWISRDDFSASITVRLHTENDEPDLYQSIELGKMTSIETENYIYPLYCGGGSIGLSADIYVYVPITGGPKTHIEGNVYDLDMNNISLSNSNILHPTKFYNSTFSNFKVLTPEGIWRSIFYHEQTASVVPYPSLGPPPDYAIHLNTPTHSLGNNKDGAYPYLDNNLYSAGSQHIIKYNNFKRNIHYCSESCDSSKYIFSSRLDAIRVMIKNSVGNGQYFSYGSIPHCWMSWDKEIPSGEFVYNNKRYLSIPCGWDGRLWDYGWHLDIYNDTWETFEVIDHFEDKYYKQNARIEDKLIIELGDV